MTRPLPGPFVEIGLLDAGAGSADEVLAALDAAGTRALAWAAVSHYDAHHLGDVRDVAGAAGVTVGQVYDRGGERTANDTDRAYVDWLAIPETPPRTAVDIGGQGTLCDGAETVTFTVVSAGTDGTAASAVPVEEENDRSVACLSSTRCLISVPAETPARTWNGVRRLRSMT